MAPRGAYSFLSGLTLFEKACKLILLGLPPCSPSLFKQSWPPMKYKYLDDRPANGQRTIYIHHLF